MIDSAGWPAAWARMPQHRRDAITRIIGKYAGLMEPRYTTTPAPTYETFLEVTRWQALETEILERHCEWLTRTKALFERRGWPWTTRELAARSHIREVGE
jgi:hypothetical protein